jgi:hypothetical protein
MEREIESLRQYDVYEEMLLDQVPKTEKPLDSTWIYAEKEMPDKQVLEKARICIRGDKQQGDFTLEDIFAGVIRTENVIIILTVIAAKGWNYVIVGVKTAKNYVCICDTCQTHDTADA